MTGIAGRCERVELLQKLQNLQQCTPPYEASNERRCAQCFISCVCARFRHPTPDWLRAQRPCLENPNMVTHGLRLARA
jgi:hypothetical protein